jgi:hypothetical protein
LIRPDGRDQSWVNHRACSKAWVSRRCPSFKAAVISRAKPASSSSASAATDAVKLEKVLVTGCTNRAGYRVGDDTAYTHDVLSNIAVNAVQ